MLFRSLVQSVEPGFDYYEAADPSVQSLHRRDKSLRYRIIYGVPLKVLKIVPKPLQDVTVAVTYEFFRSLSTITNYTYNNQKVQVLLIKTIEF